MSDNRRLPLFAPVVINDGVQLLGIVLSDVVADFGLSFYQTGKQQFSRSVALKRFQKDLAMAVAVATTAQRVA